jgi:hypothetical protein
MIISVLSNSIYIFKVDESTKTDDYYDRTHRHSFSYMDQHYVFYIDDNYHLVYKTITDGSMTSKEVIVDTIWSYADFGLVQEGEYVYLVYSTPENIRYILNFMRGKIESDTIVWENPVTLGEGDRPFIDLHLGNPVIVYSVRREKSYKWIISSDEEGNDWSEPRILITWDSGDKDFFPAVYSLEENGLMFIYWHGGTDRVYSVRYLDENYSSPVLLYNCFDYPMEYQFFYYCWDVSIVDNDKVYFLNPVGEVLVWSTGNESWVMDRIGVLARKESPLGFSRDTETGELYLFSIYKETGDFGYYLRNEAGWGEFIEVIKIEGYKLSGNSNEDVTNGSVGIRWFEEGENSMKIKYGVVRVKESVDSTHEVDLENEKNLLSPEIMFTLTLLIGFLAFLINKLGDN